MSYRISKNCFYEQPKESCSVMESSIFQLEHLNSRFQTISRELIEQQDKYMFTDYEAPVKSAPQAIYELGSLINDTVMVQILTLDGYRAFHQTLKKMNADFHFQILPSAGMMRQHPLLMLVVERFRNYASNMTDKNRHMYPDFGANDNGGLGKEKAEGVQIASAETAAFMPLCFRFC